MDIKYMNWKEKLNKLQGDFLIPDPFNPESRIEAFGKDTIKAFISTLLEKLIEDIPEDFDKPDYRNGMQLLKKQLKAKWLNK